jgi:hypothetical protein
MGIGLDAQLSLNAIHSHYRRAEMRALAKPQRKAGTPASGMPAFRAD